MGLREAARSGNPDMIRTCWHLLGLHAGEDEIS
ncbi:MAG: hypothetical protein L0H63_11110 [Nitrococcus sp.]|nr:hypothetical protein [Nitrococcus sp.]